MEFIKLYRIRFFFFFSISAFTCLKEIEEKRIKKRKYLKSLQIIKRTTECIPTRTSDK